MTAEILGYSRSRGIYAGISLEGSTLREDADANDAMFGRKVSNREVLSGGVKAPESAARFLEALAKARMARRGSGKSTPRTLGRRVTSARDTTP